MSVYSNFFTPQTISILFCLHEATKQAQQFDPKNPIVQFLIKKILKITQQSNIQLTNEGFQAEMFSLINNIQFLERYRQILNQISSFNDFYRQVSNILKTLRSIRNNKLQQGNVVDFLVRRLYIYFQKLDFKQIVIIYQNFVDYRQGNSFKLNRHEFMLTKSIEQIKFNLQNYQLKQNPEEINRLIKDLSINDHTFKTSYVKGLLKAEQKIPVQSLHQMHKYFDKCLGNLFQQKTQTSAMSNKINHCILSSAYANLKMGHLQECLQSISQGLRISQNNSDEQSINNCIIYLYKIAQQLGKHQQQILLAEHAITHSLNLSNILLMVYSCLCYSSFQKKYNCNDSSVALLKSRSINWTDALHFSKKKIYSNFESNCKNIYHSYRSLLIPTFLHKISILIHVPQLQKLVINPFYQRKQLFDLEVYQQFIGKNQIDQLIQKTTRFLKMNQRKLLFQYMQKLKNLQKNAISPEVLIKIKSFQCYYKIEQGSSIDSYRFIDELIFICRKYGFIKEDLATLNNNINKILIKNQLFYDALVKIQQNIRHCQQNKLIQQLVVSKLLKAQVYIILGRVNEPIEIIQQVQQIGIIGKFSIETSTLFYESKNLLNQKISLSVKNDPNFVSQYRQLKENQVECLQNLLRLNCENGYLKKVKQIAFRIRQFQIQNSLIFKKQQTNIIRTVQYVQKVQKIYQHLDEEFENEQTFQKKVMLKILSLYE